jgi:1-acyl-sn-glycerol-3-phosphate acyltransferase
VTALRNNILMPLARQGLSVLSALWVIGNLTFWLLLLILCFPVSIMLRLVRQSVWLERWIQWIYQSAVKIDSFWMFKVVGIRFEIEGTLPNTTRAIVIANHQSWFDIPIVQEIISARGPRLTFLIKDSLAWVPIIGWICLLLGFPRLKRSGLTSDRAADLHAVEQAAIHSRDNEHALLVFAEGTRFTAAKRLDQGSPYAHLLHPKGGGLAAACDIFPSGTPIIDIAIHYEGSSHFWDCLGGATRTIRIKLTSHTVTRDLDAKAFLNTLWDEKDAWLEACETNAGSQQNRL